MVSDPTTGGPSAVESQFLDGAAFLAAIETALANGESDTVAMNVDTLDRLIADLSSRKKHLDELVRRASDVRQRYQILSTGQTGSYVADAR
ncbi:MAG: hypothetical protein GX591_03050 [Planctomycetes bacterium]|nr:hypothetical protein [Planctomycetota bacterium]